MKIRSLILAIIFQILLIIAMLAYALMPLYLGKEIKVRVNLYDPRDLFRGNYVNLSYDFSNLQQSKFDEKTGVEIYIYDRNFSKNDEIYAVLKQDANATYAFDKFSFTKPKDALFLAGKFDGYSLVKYGIEEFYMPTKKAKQTEREMMDQDVDAVAVLISTAATMMFASEKKIFAYPTPKLKTNGNAKSIKPRNKPLLFFSLKNSAMLAMLNTAKILPKLL